MSEPGPGVGAQGEAEAGRAVADLKRTVGTQEGFSLAAAEVVDRLQVVVHRNVAQLLPSVHPPPPSPQEKDGGDQNQDQDGQKAGHGDGGGGGLGGLAQSGLEAGLQRELTAGTHEAFGALADRSGEVGEAGASILAGPGAARVRAHAAVLAGVAQRAGAGVVVHAVLAGSCILAGAGGAVVHVDLAVGAAEARLTAAQDAVAQIQTLTTCRTEKDSAQQTSGTNLRVWRSCFTQLCSKNMNVSLQHLTP